MGNVLLSRSRYVECGKFQIHFIEWGDSKAPSIVMWHGLARTCRDFDNLALRLSPKHRIICPDTIGRGLSSWSSSGGEDYHFEIYERCAVELFDLLNIETADWIGTSMGGALGIRVAAGPLRKRIRRLVLNDIGPTIPQAPYERIKKYIGNPPSFATMTELERYVRTVYEPFGWHSDDQWLQMTERLSRRLPDGTVSLHYDPRIVQQMFDHPNDFELWNEYQSLSLPTLVLRGANSDLLQTDIAEWMTKNGPCAEVVEIPNCGHAPGLNVAEQIELVASFIEK